MTLKIFRPPACGIISSAGRPDVSGLLRIDAQRSFIIDLSIGTVSGCDAIWRDTVFHPVYQRDQIVPGVRTRAAPAVSHAGCEEQSGVVLSSVHTASKRLIDHVL